MENQKSIIKKELSIKEESKGINLKNIKIDLKKGKSNLLDKENRSSSKSIYKGLEGLSSDGMKKKRGEIRRLVKGYINSILGKDRSENERTKSIESFLSFYQSNWKIQDFKIENFSNSKNESDRKDMINLLDYLKSILG